MNDTTTELPPPPPPPPPADGRPPLVRRRHGRMLAGVAAGLARHLRIDVTLVRIAFVILAFTGGAGILGYVAGWVLLPEEDDDSAEPAVWTVHRGAPFWIGVGLLVLAAIVLVEHTTPFASSVGTPIVLIAVGAALWKVSQDRADGPPSATSAPPPAPAPGADEAPADAAAASDAGTATTQPVPTVSGWTPPPVPPRTSRRRTGDRGRDWTPPPARPPSVLGRATVALALIAVGGGALLDELALVQFTVLDAAATALLVVGLGLVVGTWFGRARGLIGLGVLLVPVVAVASLVQGTGIDVRDGAGERVHAVGAGDRIASEYSLGAGYLELDLTAMDPPARDARTDVRLGAGEVLLRVPEGTAVVIDATVQLGAISTPDAERGGPGLTERLVLGDPDASGGTLHIDVEIGVGELDVRIVPEDRA